MEVEIKNLFVSVGEKSIINNLNLKIRGGEIHAIMGPNGSGKTTLSYALAGSPVYETRGYFLLDGENLLDMKPDERAKKGVFLSFQSPPFIEGVSVLQLIKKSYFSLNNLDSKDITSFKKFKAKVDDALELLDLNPSFLKRDVNKNFSGGEKKKMEALQMLVIKPSFIILDEVDSGLDVDSLNLISKAVNSLKSEDRAFLIITHYNRILKNIEPDFVHIMKKGRLIKSGNKKLALEIEEKGYTYF